MRKITLFIAIAISSLYADAQYKWDVGGSIGAASALTDIGGPDTDPKNTLFDLDLPATRYAIGGFVRYNFYRNFAAKASLNYVRLSGADSLTQEITKRARNLSFRSDIIALDLTAEWYFYTKRDLKRNGRYGNNFKAYVFGGFGALYHNPQAQYKGQWYDLRPLKTEGEEYDEITYQIPFGVGFFFTIQKQFRIGMDFGYRATFTDYLDDASDVYVKPAAMANDPIAPILANRTQERRLIEGDEKFPHPGFYQPGAKRSNPDTKDGYFLTQVSVSYVLQGKSTFYKKRYRGIVKKKRRRTKF